jgi:hypothetical protein
VAIPSVPLDGEEAFRRDYMNELLLGLRVVLLQRPASRQMEETV